MGQNLICDESDINRILLRMAHEIIEIHRGVENLAIIGIHTRGVFLAKRLSSIIHNIENVEIQTGDVDITLYRDDWTRISHHPIVKTTLIPFSIDNKNIVLVDDVLFTGRTVRSAMDEIMDFGRPGRVELAVLVDRNHRELPIQANYVGKFIETTKKQRVNVMLKESDGEDKIVIE
ncbi:MAG: bifunctional pyr operon transcriptional regulator/uracil phosphoribosyltransferase PyrR [Desulfobacterales bacterium]|nr:bifunctional pyr operon transcriptional regulator/uracil phosphoribosyltransferase PyrR [Desulfobacterales bacterium]